MKKLILSIALIAGYTASAQVAIDSINVNVNPNDTLFMEIFEGETSVIGTLGGADVDGADNLTISLSNTTDFVVTPASANITAADGDIGDISPVVAFDADVQSEYVFTTTLTDAGGLSASAITSVKVRRRGIVDIKPNAFTLAENVMTPSIFPMEARRVKANGDSVVLNANSVSYEILSVDGTAYTTTANGTAPWPFYIGSNPVTGLDHIIVTAPLNYEDQTQYLVEVKATRGNKTYTEVLKLNVTNVNEVPYKIYVK